MNPIRSEVRSITRLALPAIVTQLGNMALQIVDLKLVGALGPTAVDAVGIAAPWIIGTLLVGMGVVMGMDPLVSQAHGAGRHADTGRALQHGVVVALLLTPVITVLWWFTESFLLLADQDPELARVAGEFTRVQIPGIGPFLIFIALRSYLQGRGIVITPMIVMLLANIFNAVCGYALIFGEFGAPELGTRGAGIATGASRVFMMVALVALVVLAKQHAGAWVPWGRESISRRGIASIFRVGIPVMLHVGLEIWAFGLSTLIVGWLAGHSVAAHSVVMRMISTTFMVPLGISFATATRVGNLIGAGDRAGAARAGWCGLALGGGAMLLCALAIPFVGEDIAAWFIDDAAVVALAATLLPLAAGFQLFDGLQVVACGILRGMGTTRPAVIINFVGYYLLALPLGAWLALPEGMNLGVAGIWWSFFAGLLAVATLFLLWIYHRGPSWRGYVE